MPTGMIKGYQSDKLPKLHHLIPDDYKCVNRHCNKTKADGARFGISGARLSGKPYISRLCNSCTYDKSKLSKQKIKSEKNEFSVAKRREKISKDIKDYFEKEYK